MRILVIDDSKADRELIITHIKKFKKRKKIETDECNCLKDGLNKLKSFHYDVIILDLVLPESDGIKTVKTTLEYLKKIHKNIPIVILTGMEDYAIGMEAWMLGVKEFLIKDEIQTQDLSRALNFATNNNSNIKQKSILI